MEEKVFRNKIHWFTFLFSVLVIWVHSYNAVLYLGKNTLSYKLDIMERFLGGKIAQIAVPGFFLISSYLFFRNFSLKYLWQKWNSRIKSILVPYIVWNLLYYIGYVAGSRIPVLKDIIGKGIIPFSIVAAADAVLNYRYNYVFWYLYQMILLIILAPVIFLIMKRIWLGLLFLVSLFLMIDIGVSLPFLNLDACLYFSAAAFAAIWGKSIAESIWSKKRCAAGIVLLVLGILAGGIDLPGSGKGEIAAATVLLRLLVPIGLWLAVPEQRLPEAREWMKNNFFLYASHFAIVRLINKTGAFLLPPVPVIPLVIFLFMPLFVVGFTQLISQMMKKTVPTIWGLLNGGR